MRVLDLDSHHALDREEVRTVIDEMIALGAFPLPEKRALEFAPLPLFPKLTGDQIHFIAGTLLRIVKPELVA